MSLQNIVLYIRALIFSLGFVSVKSMYNLSFDWSALNPIYVFSAISLSCAC